MKLKNATVSVGVCAALLALVGACETEGVVNVSTGVETTGATIRNTQAIQAVTAARCNREVACNGIGEGRTYADYATCSHELGLNTQATLRDANCPQGVYQDRLGGCLDEINTERCGNPLVTIDELAACRRGMLCK